MSTTPRTRKTRKTAPAPLTPPAPGPTRAERIADALGHQAHARAVALARKGPPRGSIPPEWVARKAGWLARHIDPAFDPETIAKAALRDYNDRRFLALLPGPA